MSMASTLREAMIVRTMLVDDDRDRYLGGPISTQTGELVFFSDFPDWLSGSAVKPEPGLGDGLDVSNAAVFTGRSDSRLRPWRGYCAGYAATQQPRDAGRERGGSRATTRNIPAEVFGIDDAVAFRLGKNRSWGMPTDAKIVHARDS